MASAVELVFYSFASLYSYAICYCTNSLRDDTHFVVVSCV